MIRVRPHWIFFLRQKLSPKKIKQDTYNECEGVKPLRYYKMAYTQQVIRTVKQKIVNNRDSTANLLSGEKNKTP